MWWRGGEANFELVVFSSYEIEEGKIAAQTIHYTVEKKVGCGPHTLRRRSGQQAYRSLYHGERATQQECYPYEAFAAILSEPDLTNPQHDRPEAEHQAPHAPRPEDQRQDRASYEQDRGRQPQHSRTRCISRRHQSLAMMPPILARSELLPVGLVAFARGGGQALKRLRENYPLTVRELESKSGVSRVTIGNIENHGQNARPSTVRKLAGALGITPRELIDAD